jgi:putative two-component system hydrogenase maturation factor HypX/HoxX
VVSALTGDAAAGGVPFALAADYVLAREDVVINPYYRHMGGLYGSEYWTYLLPRRVGEGMTATLTSAPFEPLGASRAAEIGLIDDAFGDTADQFHAGVRRRAEQLASSPTRLAELAEKRRGRARDEQRKPLAAYRADELARSRSCFFGTDPSYHEARRRFVYKL